MALAPSTTVPFPTPTTFVIQARATTNFNIVTTPYTYRPTCDPHVLNSLCSASPTVAYAIAYSTFLCVNTVGQSWKSCQPQLSSVFQGGWRASGIGVDTWTTWAGSKYDAAVCPSGWWALNVGLSESKSEGLVSLEPVSTATCCKSGDSLGEDIFQLYGSSWAYRTRYTSVCVHSWSKSGQETRFVQSGLSWASDGVQAFTTVPMPAGTAYYPGWTIEWVSTDTSTLSPSWPTLTSRMLIPTWTAGMVIRDGQYDNKAPVNDPEESGEDEDDVAAIDKIPRKLWKIIVPAAVVGFFVVVAVVLCFCGMATVCFRKVRGWGKEKRKEMRERRGRREERKRVRVKDSVRAAAKITSEVQGKGKGEERGQKEAVEAELARLEEFRRQEISRRQLSGQLMTDGLSPYQSERERLEREKGRRGEEDMRGAAGIASEVEEEDKGEVGGQKEMDEVELARLEELRRQKVLRRQLNGE